MWCLPAIACAGIYAVPYFLAPPAANASLDGRGYYDPFDSDGDNMSDSWEIAMFGSIEARDGTEDDDLDERTNLEEWQGGTHPLMLDPKSVGESGYLEVSQPEANESGLGGERIYRQPRISSK